MKIVSFGVESEANPFELIVNNYLRKNFDYSIIIGSRSGYFPVIFSLLNNYKSSIFHFHWLDLFWKSPKPYKSYFKVVQFIFEIAILKMVGKKIIWTVHNIENHDKKQLFLEKIVVSWMLFMSDTIHVYCGQTARVLKEKFIVNSRKIIEVPFISYRGHYPTSKNNKLKKTLGFKKNQTVFLFLGTVRKYKGVDVLVKAFKKAQVGNSHLLIAGWVDPAIKAEILSIVKDESITLVDKHVAPSKLADYFAITDWYVLPYKEVLNSSALFLGYTFGKPMIAPQLGCVKSNFNSEHGVVLKSSTVKELVSSLKVAKNMSRKQYKYISEKNFKKSTTHSIENLGEHYHQLYNSIG